MEQGVLTPETREHASIADTCCMLLAVGLQVTLSEPVLITGITILPADGEGSKRQVFKAWARDLTAPASARFTALFGAVTGPCEAAAVAQVSSAPPANRQLRSGVGECILGERAF